MSDVLTRSRGRPASEVLPELLAGFRALLAENADLVALFFAAGRANPAIREGLHRFVAEGQQLLADYLDSRVVAGELRAHDSKTTAQALLSAVALGQITGADIEPDSLVDMVIRGVAAAVLNFSQRAAAGDAAQLEGIFDRFERWSRARSALQLLTLFPVA